MHAGRLLETILTVVMLIFIVMILMGVLLVLEVVNFIVGQHISLPLKVGTFGYLGVFFAFVMYFAARKIYNAVRFS
ncbi:MAG: hypothetical protein G01um101431_176 [Parcubacteria group bacterium Gr01-1014_31]|nr:MAG: hypothetical protein G01um101431_176 [Parcubacteria group bacterium Gr01-1014_31]